MMRRREFLAAGPAAGVTARWNAALEPVGVEVREHRGKPTLHVRGQPVPAMLYALTDCPGGRYSWEEAPRAALKEFAAAGFRLFQLDLFLEECWTKPGPLSAQLARKQIRGVLDLCPEAAVVLRWHVNAPPWWREAHPQELTRYANGNFEEPERTQPVRTLQDDLRRTKRASLASELWYEDARAKTIELLKGLEKTEEGRALAGIHVACGVYGEWHYWGFMRNEPDVSAPMQKRFAEWRKARGKAAAAVPGVEERRALDEGIFRDPRRREAVIDYYRCQQELVAERIAGLCETVKRNWPRPLITGTFYGYFFSMFDRQATGGHLCVERVLQSKHVDYLSAPQAYGTAFRDPGGSGISRALVDSVRRNGKLFLDEMDQTPSWQWRNDVDTAFELKNLALDAALLRRNVFESFTRGAGLWFYDFGPANHAGWWLDRRLMAEIGRIRAVVNRYHERDYAPAADVLMVFDTEPFYYTGTVQGTDPLSDTLAVNRTIGSAWAAGVALETVLLRDIERMDLARYKAIVFANTWVMTAEQRQRVRRLAGERACVFQGLPAYCDGSRLSVEFSREATGLDLRPVSGQPFAPALGVSGVAGLHRQGNVWFSTAPVATAAGWREIFRAAGAHIYTESGDVIHAGGGVVLLHSKEGGARTLRLRSGRTLALDLPGVSSWVFDAGTGERLL